MKKFKYIFIEITNICNLACTFCPNTNRKFEFINIDNFNKILDEIKPYTDYIYLHIKGEPLLHPNLSSLLDIAYQKGFKVNITTNGTLLNKVKDELLNKPALRQINISLHSISGNNLKNYEEYLYDVIKVGKELSINNIYVSLRLWNLQDNNNIDNNQNEEILNIIADAFRIENIKSLAIKSKSIKLTNNIFLNQDQEFQWPSLDANEISENGFCYALRTHLGILVDGTTVPCCLDGEGIINLGNIYEKPFSEIINSKRAKAIYNGFSNNKAIEELCRKCGYRKIRLER